MNNIGILMLIIRHTAKHVTKNYKFWKKSRPILQIKLTTQSSGANAAATRECKPHLQTKYHQVLYMQGKYITIGNTRNKNIKRYYM